MSKKRFNMAKELNKKIINQLTIKQKKETLERLRALNRKWEDFENRPRHWITSPGVQPAILWIIGVLIFMLIDMLYLGIFSSDPIDYAKSNKMAAVIIIAMIIHLREDIKKWFKS